jgi:carboxyl-terminal processing protease
MHLAAFDSTPPLLMFLTSPPPLQDGSALFVTVARYQTPAGTEIDKVGINPDRACSLPGAAARGDSSYVAGLPMIPGSEAALLESLMGDDCVAAARSVLRDEVAMVANAARVATDIVRPIGVRPLTAPSPA